MSDPTDDGRVTGATDPSDSPPVDPTGRSGPGSVGDDGHRLGSLMGFMSVPVHPRFPMRRSTLLMAVAFAGLGVVLYFNPPSSGAAASTGPGAVVHTASGDVYVPGAYLVPHTTTTTTTRPAPTTTTTRATTTTRPRPATTTSTTTLSATSTSTSTTTTTVPAAGGSGGAGSSTTTTSTGANGSGTGGAGSTTTTTSP